MSAPHIRLAVDAVVFGYNPKEGISVLLIQRKYPPFQSKWAIPGGLVQENEDLEDAVHRELLEETGVKLDYLEQLYTFGKNGRDPRNRVVSVAYFGLIRESKFELLADTDAADAQWFLLSEVPELAFDHHDILDTAITRLRGKIPYQPIGFHLLDQKFPFSELHKLYEAILGAEIDRRNFKKKFLALGILEELEEKISEGRGRPGALYRFKEEEYFQLLEKGMSFEI